MSRVLGILGVGVSFFASGLIVGLGFIAAAVKFTATRPDVLDLLDVGRVQFSALHTIEWVLVPIACVALMFGSPRLAWLVTLTFGCFLVQAVAIEPALHARMLARLAEQPVGGSNLHGVYVGVSFALCALLVVQGFAGLTMLARRSVVRQQGSSDSSGREGGARHSPAPAASS